MAATVHLLGLGDIFTVCIVSGVHCTVQAEAEESLFLQLPAALLLLLCRPQLSCRFGPSSDQGKHQSAKVDRSLSTGPYLSNV